MNYLGDFSENAVLRFKFNTSDSSGASSTMATNGTITVYKDGDTVGKAVGVTFSKDWNGVTGVHMVTVDLSADSYYVAGADYSVVLSGAIVDGVAINSVLKEFSVENRFEVMSQVMAESYAADGAAMTLAQAQYEMIALLGEWTKFGATMTYKRRDGVTPAFTGTLDNPNTPTSHTRSS